MIALIFFGALILGIGLVKFLRWYIATHPETDLDR